MSERRLTPMASPGLFLESRAAAHADKTGHVQVYNKAGVLTWVNDSGTEETIGAPLPLANIPDTATFVVATEAANVITVTATLKDVNGTALTAARTVFCYLSIAATGVGPITDANIPDTVTLVGTPTTGTLATGVVLDPAAATPINGKAAWLTCSAAGVIAVGLGDAGILAPMYLTIVSATGKLSVSAAITFA